MTNQRTSRVAMLLLNKIDFRRRNVTRDEVTYFHNVKGINLLKQYNNPKCICPWLTVLKYMLRRKQ